MENKVEQLNLAASVKAQAILDGTAPDKYSIDSLTVIVKGNGPALHDFVYSLPNSDGRLMAAKQSNWSYVKTQQFKVGDVVTFACICVKGRGSKTLQPFAVAEVSRDEKWAGSQSKRWNSLLVQEGAEAFMTKVLTS